MHRDPSGRLVHRRQQRADLDVASLPEDVDEPRAVLSARPGNQTFGHLVILSSGHLVIWSSGHLVIGHFVVQFDSAWRDPCVTRRTMSEQSEQLKERTLEFALDVLRLIDTFPRTIAADAVARQLAKSAPSIAANYRGTCNARSRKEFIAKLGIVVEESDESLGWLQLLIDSAICTSQAVKSLAEEANELVSIFVQSEKTARRNYEAEIARRRAALKRKSNGRRP